MMRVSHEHIMDTMEYLALHQAPDSAPVLCQLTMATNPALSATFLAATNDTVFVCQGSEMRTTQRSTSAGTHADDTLLCRGRCTCTLKPPGGTCAHTQSRPAE